MTGKNTICINWNTHPHYHNKNTWLSDEYGIVANIINLSDITLTTTKSSIKKLLDNEISNKVNYDMIRNRAIQNLTEVIDAI